MTLARTLASLREMEEADELRCELARLQAQAAEQTAEIAALRALAHEDALTGLLNRRGFEHDFARAASYSMRYGTSVALLLADLDAFKPINDRHGHAAGDAALRHVAGILGSHLRASDSLARVGGDEFAFLLWQVDADLAEQKARALEAILSDTPCPWRSTWLSVAASIGSTMLDPADDVASALVRADDAMYARKRSVLAFRR